MTIEIWPGAGVGVGRGTFSACYIYDAHGSIAGFEVRYPGTELQVVYMTDPGSCTWNNLLDDSGLDLDTDLTNDHPVSVVYDTTAGGLRPESTLISTIDLTSDLAPSAGTAYDGNLGQNRWAVNGFIDNGSARISDLLRNGKVECSSCHDPHFSNRSWDEVEGAGGYEGLTENTMDGLFLRRVGGNTGSGVCRTCHNK